MFANKKKVKSYRLSIILSDPDLLGIVESGFSLLSSCTYLKSVINSEIQNDRNHK